MKKDLTEGSVLKALLTFAIPIFGANLLQAMYGTVDLMIVGLFADRCEVSAVSTGSMTLMTITAIITGLSMGSTVLLGQYIGMRKNREATHAVASSALLFGVLGIIMTVLVSLLAVPVTSLMNAPTEAFHQTTAYIRICGYGILCIVLFNALSGVFRGIGDSKSPFLLMLIACVCNIIGDLLLVGVLNLGSAGAAIATVAAQGISVISAFFIIKKRGLGFAYEKKDLVPRRQETLRILRYGLPIAAQEAMTGISFMVIQAVLNRFGVVASAGVGVGEKICGLMFIAPVAMMSAVSAFTAQNMGAGQYKRAKEGMRYSMVVSFAFAIAMSAVSFFKGVWLSSFFSNDMEVCVAAADYLKSYSLDVLLVGFNFSMMGYFNGMGQTLFVALQGIASTFLLRIPVAFFMSKIPGVSLFQVGCATPIASVFSIIVDIIFFLWFEKKRKRVM